MKWIMIYTRLLLRYMQYYFKARTRYDLHSPYVFKFTEAVLEDNRQFYAFRDIELMRRGLLKDQGMIQREDYGAGSLVSNASRRTVRDIARFSAVSPAGGQFLFRLVQFLKPGTLLELGTSLGISGAYQASAAGQSQMISIEGCPQTAALAQKNLNRLGIKNIEILQGTFEEQLPAALRKTGPLDYLYLDGDHRKNATLDYFEACLPYLHANSVAVVADIHWSDEMEAAWKTLRKMEIVSLSVDVFHFGLLFFRTEQKSKRALHLIRSKYKPWRMGFFSSAD